MVYYILVYSSSYISFKSMFLFILNKNCSAQNLHLLQINFLEILAKYFFSYHVVYS